MKLYKLTVVALILAARTCHSEIVIATSKPDKSTARLLDDLVNIVTSCYKDHINGIVLAGDLPGSLLRKLSVQHLIPVALVDNIMDWDDHPPDVPVKSRHKLNIFVVEAHTWQKLDTLIGMNLPHSIWWNHLASFFILDLSSGCLNAQNYVWIAWRRNVLNAKSMCTYKNETFIFNYNPFTGQAPVSWKRDFVYPGIMKHPFTVFHQIHKENKTMCADLDFEKRKDLGGYIVRIEGRNAINRLNIPTNFGPVFYRFWTINGNIFRNIFLALNARPTFSRRTNWNMTEDIHIDRRWIQYSWDKNALTTYPHGETGLAIVTQHRGHKSLLNKLLSIIDINSWYGVGIVYFITPILLKIFVRQALVPVLLNLIRITCNTGFTNIPLNTASRIYLTGLLIFVVTIQGIFKSNLSYLSQNISLNNVDTQQNLVDWGFKKIHGTRAYENFITHPDLTTKFVGNENLTDCIMRVRDDWLTACICSAKESCFEMARMYNLYMSREYIGRNYHAYRIRWNWPLEESFNKIIRRMVEHRILEPWDMKWAPIKIRDPRLDREINTDKIIKVIELHELRFAFVILGVGLVGATIAFIVEFATQLEYSIRIKRRQRRNRLIKTLVWLSRSLG